MVPDDLIQVVLRVIKSEAEARLSTVDVDSRELHDVFVAQFTQQQDLTDGCGGQAITLLWAAAWWAAGILWI